MKLDKLAYDLFYEENKNIVDDYVYYDKFMREQKIYYEKAKILFRKDKLEKIINDKLSD